MRPPGGLRTAAASALGSPPGAAWCARKGSAGCPAQDRQFRARSVRPVPPAPPASGPRRVGAVAAARPIPRLVCRGRFHTRLAASLGGPRSGDAASDHSTRPRPRRGCATVGGVCSPTHSPLYQVRGSGAWLAHGTARARGSVLGYLTPKRAHSMFRYTLSYARYLLTALSTVAFKLAAN